MFRKFIGMDKDPVSEGEIIDSKGDNSYDKQKRI